MFNDPLMQRREQHDPRATSPQQKINADLGKIELYWGIVRNFDGSGDSHVVLSGTPLLSGMMDLHKPVQKCLCCTKFDYRKMGLAMGGGTMIERVNDITCSDCRDLIGRVLDPLIDQ